MKILSGLSLEEIEKITDELHASKFRARQIHNWIYLKSVKNIDEMTDLSVKFREELKQVATVTDVQIKVKQVSSDGTIKYLIQYPDGECVETVLMRFDNRANLTACVSSQIGCAVNCSFCATGKRGFIRNLSYKEIIEQVLTIQRDTGLKVTNIVFMGQGEPLLNLKNVLQALDIFNKNFQIGARRITISTSGIVPQIKELANKTKISENYIANKVLELAKVNSGQGKLSHIGYYLISEGKDKLYKSLQVNERKSIRKERSQVSLGALASF